MIAKRKAKRFKPREQPEFKKKPVSKQKGFGTEMPPDYALVIIYFDQKEAANQASSFYNWYESINWTGPRGAPYRNWKILASDWIFNYQQQLKLSKRLRGNRL
jgi:hypothetical protein